MKPLVRALVLCAALPLLGCDSFRLEPRFDFVPQIGSLPKDPLKATAEKLGKELEKKYEEFDDELQKLKDDVGDLTGDAKTETEKRIRDLEKILADMKREIAKLGE